MKSIRNKKIKNWHNGKHRTKKKTQTKNKAKRIICCQGEERKAIESKLLAELKACRPEFSYNTVSGNWEPNIPHWFVKKHKKHMHHFKRVAKDHGFKN